MHQSPPEGHFVSVFCCCASMRNLVQESFYIYSTIFVGLNVLLRNTNQVLGKAMTLQNADMSGMCFCFVLIFHRSGAGPTYFEPSCWVMCVSLCLLMTSVPGHRGRNEGTARNTQAAPPREEGGWKGEALTPSMRCPCGIGLMAHLGASLLSSNSLLLFYYMLILLPCIVQTMKTKAFVCRTWISQCQLQGEWDLSQEAVEVGNRAVLWRQLGLDCKVSLCWKQRNWGGTWVWFRHLGFKRNNSSVNCSLSFMLSCWP